MRNATQTELMVTFMEEHRTLATDSMTDGSELKTLWDQLTDLLNGAGTARDDKAWKKVNLISYLVIYNIYIFFMSISNLS